jgi:hypothetical protein
VRVAEAQARSGAPKGGHGTQRQSWRAWQGRGRNEERGYGPDGAGSGSLQPRRAGGDGGRGDASSQEGGTCIGGSSARRELGGRRARVWKNLRGTAVSGSTEHERFDSRFDWDTWRKSGRGSLCVEPRGMLELALEHASDLVELNLSSSIISTSYSWRGSQRVHSIGIRDLQRDPFLTTLLAHFFALPVFAFRLCNANDGE